MPTISLTMREINGLYNVLNFGDPVQVPTSVSDKLKRAMLKGGWKIREDET